MNAFGILVAAQPFAFDILERTASTPQVQAVVQQSLAPAFLLGAIGAIMNVIMSRMIWIAGRIERIEEMHAETQTERAARELAWLERRRRAAQRAISFATAAAVNISLVIGLVFLAAYIKAKIGSLIAFLWVLTMVLLVTGLVHFLHETRLAARGFTRDG
ncbi:DUF2721 domain-containing protein [Erythrobacter sp. HL-111]|uniref:DUF2721 domain-containing protein n=1 Tax=Erythrobacter sp. HL-111 TaxID=1798193 RepID=UPI0006D95003|nr:DUF2721 domain-containing protein [Erythrobacter sp. HL-111]KPP91235.1 MAG: membrane protein of unknown function DUF2721 [Erythrobacteraceae bacterium HL-111]SDT06999.1 Protein of unknown function [Erythrobacter sp. HL-111]